MEGCRRTSQEELRLGRCWWCLHQHSNCKHGEKAVDQGELDVAELMGEGTQQEGELMCGREGPVYSLRHAVWEKPTGHTQGELGRVNWDQGLCPKLD